MSLGLVNPPPKRESDAKDVGSTCRRGEGTDVWTCLGRGERIVRHKGFSGR